MRGTGRRGIPGTASPASPGGQGGQGADGGGLRNAGTLVLDRATVTGNHAGNGGDGGPGASPLMSERQRHLGGPRRSRRPGRRDLQHGHADRERLHDQLEPRRRPRASGDQGEAVPPLGSPVRAVRAASGTRTAAGLRSAPALPRSQARRSMTTSRGTAALEASEVADRPSRRPVALVAAPRGAEECQPSRRPSRSRTAHSTGNHSGDGGRRRSRRLRRQRPGRQRRQWRQRRTRRRPPRDQRGSDPHGRHGRPQRPGITGSRWPWLLSLVG